MLSRKFILAFSAVLLVFAIVIHAMREEHVLSFYEKKDIFKEFETITAESSIKFEEVKNKYDKKVLVLYNSNEANTKALYSNFKKVLDYMKTTYVSVDVNDFQGDFKAYSSVILCFEDIESFKYFDALFNYLDIGGSVIFAQKPKDINGRFESIYRRIGIYEKGGLKAVTSLKLNSNILIGGAGLSISKDFYTPSVVVHLQDDCEKIAESMDGLAVIWQKRYGKGKLIFVNGDLLSDKVNRGLISGIIAKSQEDFIYPIINAKVLFIDNFPSPVLEGYNKEIEDKYRRTKAQFYRDIWWEEMLSITKRHNLKLTGGVVKSNENSEESTKNLKYFGRELFKSGGELGIQEHNYNESETAASLKDIDDYIKSIYKVYSIENYVQSSNNLSVEERKKLKEVFPNLKVISSMYTAGEGEYEQEFDIGEDGIVDFPRLSYGFALDDKNKWAMYNGITTHGVFSHFVLPNEIDNKIIYENKEIEDIMEEFDKVVGRDNKFKWLKSSTATEAALELKTYSESDSAFRYEENKVLGYINKFKNHMYFILRTEKPIKNVSSCQAIEIEKGSYIIKALLPEFYIELGEIK